MRHGQVDNPQGVMYERLPGFHLSALGREMAARSAQFFAGLSITHLRCSPLERAQETMEPVARLFPHLEVVLDPQVTEGRSVFAGQVMGTTARAAQSPKNWRYLLNPLRPSWGEPYRVIAERMTAAILESAEIAGEEAHAVIVSHELPIWMARRQAEGRHLWHDPRKRQCKLASVTSFRVHAGAIVSVSYAEPAAGLLPNTPHFGF